MPPKDEETDWKNGANPVTLFDTSRRDMLLQVYTSSNNDTSFHFKGLMTIDENIKNTIDALKSRGAL